MRIVDTAGHTIWQAAAGLARAEVLHFVYGALRAIHGHPVHRVAISAAETFYGSVDVAAGLAFGRALEALVSDRGLQVVPGVAFQAFGGPGLVGAQRASRK